MDSIKVCDKCGMDIPADAPEGRCPRCLMAAGMETLGADTLLEAELERSEPIELEVFEEIQGKYTMLGEHARGGMGRVLLVHDESLGRQVALKELLPGRGSSSNSPTPAEAQQAKELASRFLREARITGQLEHPSITPVHELGRREDGSLYYTMKLVKGKTLKDAIKECETLEERLKLLPHFVDLCNAIAYAHSRNVIHRDIKPANVMIGEYGETVILDWGLAKVKDPNETSDAGQDTDPNAETVMGVQQDTPTSGHKTSAGQLLGTPVYMSPEQAKGLPADERSDIYSLGAVLYEILTGKPPFDGKTVDEIIAKVIHEEVDFNKKTVHKIDKRLLFIAKRAIAKISESRYTDAQDVAKLVDKWKPRSYSKVRIAAELILFFAVIVPNFLFPGWLRTIGNPILFETEFEKATIRAAGGSDPGLYLVNPRTMEPALKGQGQDWNSPHWLIERETYFPQTSEKVRTELDDLMFPWELKTQYDPVAETTTKRKINLEPIYYEFDEQQHEVLRKYVEAGRATLETLFRIADMPAGTTMINGPKYLGENDLIRNYPDHYFPVSFWVSLLLGHAQLELNDQDEEDYVQAVIAMANLLEHLRDRPYKSPLIVISNCWMSEQLIRDVSKRLDLHQLGEDSIRELIRLPYSNLESIRISQSVKFKRDTMTFEDASWHWSQRWNIGILNFGEWNDLTNLIKMEDEHAWLHYHNSVLKLLDDGIMSFRRDASKLYTELQNNESKVASPIVFAFLPESTRQHILEKTMSRTMNYGISTTLILKEEVNVSLLRVRMACELYRIDTGDYPDSLNDLVSEFGNDFLLDRFNGKPFRYMRKEDGIIIYSVGDDEDDDNGESWTYDLQTKTFQGDISIRIPPS